MTSMAPVRRLWGRGRPVTYATTATATLGGGTASATTNSPAAVIVTLNGPVPPGGYTATLGRSGVAGSLAASSLVFTFGGATTLSTTNTNTADGTSQVTLTGAGLTPAGTPQSYTSAAPAASSGDLPTLNTLTSAITGTLPFSIGQPFKQGALAAGATLAGLQLDPVTYWPNGSIKHAIVSGTAAMTAGVPYSIAMTIGAAATGATLTTSDLAAALPDGIPYTAGAFGSATIAGADFASPAQVVKTGPKCSHWVYRKQIGSDPHLVAWAEIWMHSTGAVEVFPWVENGYVGVASPTNKSATYTFSLGGTQRFSAAIDIKHHTRIPLISATEGSARTFSHWLGTDPGVAPAHDGAYLRATKVIPNSYWSAPSGAVLDATQQAYTPNTLAGDSNATGSTGGAGCIISAPDAMYVNSGDLRAWKAMMAHALSAGSWSWHYRDSSTHRPVVYASYASNQIGDGTIPAGTGGENHTGGPSMTHMPSYAYLPWLVTGRWWFLEELQFQATWGFLSVNPAYRNNGDHTIDTGSGFTVRGGAWSMNLAAQAAAATPSTHPLAAQFVATWERTTAKLYGKYVAGTLDGGAWVSPIGVMGSYSGDVGQPSPLPPPSAGTAWWDGIYQQNYVSAVLGYSSDIGIPQAAPSLANHIAARDHSYKLVVGRADDGFAGRYNWRRFICFGGPIGTDATGLPVETPYATHAPMFVEIERGYSLATLPSNYGLSLKQHSSDADLTSGDSSRTYGSTALAALAMAAEHGAPGASEGYQRVTGASNYATAFGTYLADESPQWAVKPRLPTDLPAAGAVADYSTNTLNAAVGRTVKWLAAWSGVAWAPWWGRAGTVVMAGGGHGDGEPNDVYALDAYTRSIAAVKSPPASSFVKSDTQNNADAAGDGWMWANTTLGNTAVQTGESPAQHHYGGLLAVPPNAIVSLGASNGLLLHVGQSAIPIQGNLGGKGIHALRMGQDQLHTLYGPSSASLSYHRGHGGVCHDRKRNRTWFPQHAGQDPSVSLAYRDLADGSESVQAFALQGGMSAWAPSYDSIEWSARHDLIVRIIEVPGSSPKAYTKLLVLDPVDSKAYQPAQTGTPPAGDPAFAACWSDVFNAWCVLRAGGGDNTVYFLKPTGDPRTEAWAWTSQAISGTLLPAQDERPAFNRLRHVPALGNVLLWAADARFPVQSIVVTAP